MSAWLDPAVKLPGERDLVTVRVKGAERPLYYRIGGRWYALEDLERWRMNTSRYWPSDRSWYLDTAQIEAWKDLDA